MWDENSGYDGGGMHTGTMPQQQQQQPWRERWRKSRLAGAIGNVGQMLGQMPQESMPPQMQNYGMMDQYKSPFQMPEIMPPRRY